MNAQQIQHELNVARAEEQALIMAAATDIADGKPMRSIPRAAKEALNFALSADLMDEDIEAVEYAESLPF